MRYFALKSTVNKVHIYEVDIDSSNKIKNKKYSPICNGEYLDLYITPNQNKAYSTGIIINYICNILKGNQEGNLCAHCVGSFFEDVQRGDK